uniref:TPR_REGION domain-containing protein n=1 Tax=Heterorhabditis bacteriophora TaxID=37862 RepID=A0A1I7XKN1_HETBA
MDQHIGLLKQFVHAIKANTNLLHDPKLDFFREYIEGMGGTIPPKKCEPESSDAEENSTSGIPSEQNTSVEEEYPPIPYPEDIDNSGVIEADNDTDLPMGDDKKEPSDEDLNKASEERENAMVAFSNDNFDEAIAHYTTAIQHNPRSAMLFAKRASVLLKLKKPVAAIRDCDKAISINPDSSQGYKFRGRAHRLLGKWVEAHNDLAMACKLDYDDSTNEWLKEVEPNVS